MSRQFLNVTSKGADDELDMFSWDSLKSFLDHMISILILDAFENVVLKFPDQLRLLVGQDVFQSLRRLLASAYGRHDKLSRSKIKYNGFSGTNLLHYTATVHLAG